MRPYKDLEITKDYIIREFDENIDPIELKWHRDNEDRVIEVLQENDWKFQFENKLPILLEINKPIIILRHDWHRVIKGKTKLLLKIHKSLAS